jgi:hypothetical protein
MRTIATALLVLCLSLVQASIPLVNTPSWSSNSNDYSTGGGFWDIDTNGYIDFCMSNGNDMALDHNAVYFNHGGTLENTASWRSSDNGNFGHLYLGDIDNDDLMDMAVAYLGPSGDHQARVYRNTGGTLTTAPWWKSKDTTTFFDCGLGDVNLDGWLDLAIAAGDAYSNTPEPLKIYFNHSGALDTLPGWQSTNLVIVDAVRFADLNNDGRLDLIANGKGRLYVYYQRGDTLERTPSWTDTTGTGVMGLRLAVGDYDNDGWPDLAAVCNGQTGSPNAVRVYHNNSGMLAKPPVWRLERRNSYSSCAAWADVNNDGWLDLAAGGWWDPLNVYENVEGVLDTVPAWTWNNSNLVAEAVVWGDVRNRHVASLDETASGDGTRKLFQVTHIPFQGFSGIEVNSVPVPRSNYSFDPLTGYVTLRDAPPLGTDNVVFHYSYSEYPDLGVTNWTNSDANYVFYNTTPVAVAERKAGPTHTELRISSALFADELRLTAMIPSGARGGLKVFSTDGRLVATIARDMASGTHALSWTGGSSLTKGLYLISLSCSNGIVLSRKVIRIR